MNERFPYNPEWPVSAKFYARLCERVRSILVGLQSYEAWREKAILHQMVRYISTGKSAASATNKDTIGRVIFQSLRAEIDSAIERSRRARASAARRKAAKQAAAVTHLSDLSDNSDLSDLSDNSDRPTLPSDSSEKSEKSEKSDLSDLSERSELSEMSALTRPVFVKGVASLGGYRDFA